MYKRKTEIKPPINGSFEQKCKTWKAMNNLHISKKKKKEKGKLSINVTHRGGGGWGVKTAMGLILCRLCEAFQWYKKRKKIKPPTLKC